MADADVEYIEGDVRDRGIVREACRRISTWCSTTSPRCLGADRDLFWSVNRSARPTCWWPLGPRRWRRSSTRRPARSSDPDHNPVDEETPGRPLEAYGRAKLQAELLCHDAVASGLDVTIVRPRTILGHGRLGIMAILFEFVAEGAPVNLLGSGDNRYQFLHADDLADACIRAGGSRGIGELQRRRHRVRHHARYAASARRSRSSGSSVWLLPTGPARTAMRTLAGMKALPFAPYHWLLYSELLYFDTTRARVDLGWTPQHSNVSMLIESYEWFLAHRAEMASTHGSHHQSPVKMGLLKALKRLPKS